MKPIKTVGVIGLGALGVLYATLFTRALGKERVPVLADGARIARYREEGVWCNGQRCDFNYVDAAAYTGPVDLLLCLTDDASFCTEYLSKAVKARFKIGRKPFDGDPFDIIVAERLAETPDPEGDTMGNRPDTQPRTASTSVIEEIFMTITEIITKIE